MKNMTLENIAAACQGKLVGADIPQAQAVGVTTDSRKAEPGCLFIALRGERTDGHRFIEDVLKNGALGVVCERLPEHPEGPCILVEDCFAALRQIGEFYRQQLDVRLVGITGSVGKTSTKEFVASVLAQKYKVHRTKGNYNNEIGVPLTVLAMPEDTQVAVLEMGINHFGEMHNLSRIARPDICIMTNIGQCHLEYLGSREGILRAKSEIFDFMAEDGTVCVNGDDDLLAGLREVKGKEPLTFGRNPKNRIWAEDVVNKGLFGSEAVIRLGQERLPVRIPLPGEHMVYNALAAAAAGSLLGLSGEEICRGIAAVSATKGRSHVIRLEDWVLIDDCYNANPVSMEAALDLLCLAEGRTVAILGDMFELGEKERQMHGRVGRYAAEKGVDCILAAGSLSCSLCGEAEKYGCREVHHFEDRDSLMEALDGLLFPGDTILVKASHGMGYEKIVEMLCERKV